jgi:hypothetical protein
VHFSGLDLNYQWLQAQDSRAPDGRDHLLRERDDENDEKGIPKILSDHTLNVNDKVGEACQEKTRRQVGIF